MTMRREGATAGAAEKDRNKRKLEKRNSPASVKTIQWSQEPRMTRMGGIEIVRKFPCID